MAYQHTNSKGVTYFLNPKEVTLTAVARDKQFTTF